jgi:hypothetical protein
LIGKVTHDVNKLLEMLDARSMEWSAMRVSRNAACSVCGGTHADQRNT